MQKIGSSAVTCNRFFLFFDQWVLVSHSSKMFYSIVLVSLHSNDVECLPKSCGCGALFILRGKVGKLVRSRSFAPCSGSSRCDN